MGLFLAKSVSIMRLTIFQKGKKLFQTIKKQKIKTVKNWDFSKAVSPWFWSKILKFSIFLFLTKSVSKMCLMIFQKGKKLFLTVKNRKLKELKIGIFPKGQSMVLVKNLKFSIFLFLAKSVSKMCLMIFQKGKKLFQAIKHTKLKKSKIGIFPKGLVHGFGQKFENFPSFYFWQNQLA